MAIKPDECKGPEIPLLEPNDPRLVDLLNPRNKSVSAVGLKLPFTEEQMAHTGNLYRQTPSVHNRIRQDIQPVEFEDESIDDDFRPRPQLDEFGVYVVDRECSEVVRYCNELFAQWVKDGQMLPVVKSVLQGALLQSKLFKAKQGGSFSFAGYLNFSRLIAVTPLHGETWDTLGVNIMVLGRALWYVLEPSKANLERLYAAYKKLEPNLGTPNLYNKNLKWVVSIRDLMKEGVVFSRFEQLPQYAIITKTGGCHVVLSEDQSIKFAQNSLVDLDAARVWLHQLKAGELDEDDMAKLEFLGEPLDSMGDILKQLEQTKTKVMKSWPDTWP